MWDVQLGFGIELNGILLLIFLLLSLMMVSSVIVNGRLCVYMISMSEKAKKILLVNFSQLIYAENIYMQTHIHAPNMFNSSSTQIGQSNDNILTNKPAEKCSTNNKFIIYNNEMWMFGHSVNQNRYEMREWKCALWI